MLHYESLHLKIFLSCTPVEQLFKINRPSKLYLQNTTSVYSFLLKTQFNFPLQSDSLLDLQQSPWWSLQNNLWVITYHPRRTINTLFDITRGYFQRYRFLHLHILRTHLSNKWDLFFETVSRHSCRCCAWLQL